MEVILVRQQRWKKQHLAGGEGEELGLATPGYIFVKGGAALTCPAGPEVYRRPAGRSSSRTARSRGGSGTSGSEASRPEPEVPAQRVRPRPAP